MQSRSTQRRRIRLILLMLAASAGTGLLTGEEPQAAPIFAGDTLAEFTLRTVITTPLSYAQLSELDDLRSRELGAVWENSVQRNRLKATLARFRSEAASATVKMFDAEEFRGNNYFQTRKVFYLSKGKPVILGIVPSVAENPETRGDAAAVIARFIIAGISDDEQLFKVDSPSRETIARAIATADRHDFPAAIKLLDEYRPLVLTGDGNPTANIYLTLGIVEGKMPGHELRAMAWFGAYLASFPHTAAPHRAAVKTQINLLYAQNQKNLERWLGSLLDSAALLPNAAFKSWVLEQTMSLAVQSKAPAIAQAAVKLFPVREDNSGMYDQAWAHRRIEEFQRKAGDLKGEQPAPDFRSPSGLSLADWVEALGDDNLNHSCPLNTVAFTEPSDHIHLIATTTASSDDFAYRWKKMIEYPETQLRARAVLVRMLSEVSAQ